MNRGYILLWRASVDNPMYFAEPFTRFQAWIDLLIMSNHDDRIVFIKGKGITVARGQVLAGEEYLATRWKWSRGKVRRYLSYLSSKTVQQIVQHKDNLCGVITICNYDTYQSRGTSVGTADSTPNDTASSTADGHQTVQQTDIPNTLINTLHNTLQKKSRSKNFASDDDIRLILSDLPNDRRQIFQEWIDYKREKKQQYVKSGLKALIKKFNNLTDDCLKAAIENSMASNYDGIFEPNPIFTKQEKQLEIYK